jgi:calcineurin-like phosphoesterase family protein
MSNIWFTADTHYYHTNVIRFCARPFSSVEEMNEAMVARWNEVVRPEDTVYHLGDFSMAARPVEVFSPRLMGKKHLIPGNHDFCHSVHQKSRHKENQDKWIKYYETHGWIVLPEHYSELGMFGMNFNMSHMPYRGDNSTVDRYTDKRPVDDGKWLLHGHVHEKWRVKQKMINVGVDVWNFYPVHLDEIRKIIYDI